MIGASPLGTIPVAAAPAGSLIYVVGAQLAGVAAVAVAPRAQMLAASAATGQAIVVTLPRRARGVSAALSGEAFVVMAYRRRVALVASLAGSTTLSVTAKVSGQLRAALFGTARIRIDPEAKFYAATRELLTSADDLPGNQPFLGTVQKALRLDRSIIGGTGFDRVTASWGYVELINAEGDYDYLIERYAVDGRRVQIKAGVAGAAYGSYVTLFDGTASNWHVAEDVLRIEIRDNTYLIEIPASPSVYAGTGGIEGGDDLKGKRRPRALGEVANIAPPLVIPSLLAYQVNAGPIQAVLAVYDRAVALTFAADFPSIAALNAATTGAAGSGAAIEAGEYATCLAEGWVQLGGSPVGQVTCDVRGDKTGGVYASTTSTIVRRLLSTVQGSTIRIMETSFGALEAAAPATIGYWLDTGSETTIADVIADLMAGIGGWGGFRRGGSFEVGVFRQPVGSPSARYGRIDVIDIERQPLPEGLSPPPYRWRVAWGRNWTVQTDVAGQAGVTDARGAFLAESYRLAASDTAAGMLVRASHLRAQDPQPVLAYFRDEADALAEAERRLALFSRTAALYRIRLKAHPFVHEIGEVIELTYPRWDLKAGRLLRLVALTEDTDDGTTEIVGYG